MVIRNKRRVENMNNEENRSNKIKELKMKSKRKGIYIKLVNIINNLEIESFISVEDTIVISKKVYKKLDTLINQEEMEKDIESNLIKVASLKEKYKIFFNENAILFHYEDRECGAIKIKVEDFFEHLADIAEFTKFKGGYRDLILVDEDLKYGICIERYEYFNKLAVWN